MPRQSNLIQVKTHDKPNEMAPHPINVKVKLILPQVPWLPTWGQLMTYIWKPSNLKISWQDNLTKEKSSTRTCNMAGEMDNLHTRKCPHPPNPPFTSSKLKTKTAKKRNQPNEMAPSPIMVHHKLELFQADLLAFRRQQWLISQILLNS